MMDADIWVGAPQSLVLTRAPERKTTYRIGSNRHAGWREDGHNGYVWTFSTPNLRYFLRRGRARR